MKNRSLAEDYILRAGNRIEAVKILFDRDSFADVVREAQEIVELCLKALLRFANIEVPHLHDVSDVLSEEKERFPAELRAFIPKLAKISKELRRDRELSFYGAEDLTPSEFYQSEDAQKALKDASFVYDIASKALGRR